MITVVLLYSCITTPVQIALYDDLSYAWQFCNYVVDALFVIDILIIFNSAIYNDDFELIEDRSMIVKIYLKGWFLLDIIAIFPFEWVVPTNGEAANLVRFIRIGRITKMLKLMKLVRLMRLQKDTGFNVLGVLQEFFNISSELRWLFKFFCFFAMGAHVVCCFWIIAGEFDSNEEKSWLTPYKLDGTSRASIYLTSFYFTITTITTVGYGDMSAETGNEMIICIFIMLVGVIAFAMASGALTNYIAQQEERSERYEAKMAVLDRLFKEFGFP